MRKEGEQSNRREGALERDQQRIVEALEAAREGISLLDDDGEFIYVNDAYADTFGYEPEEMIGVHWDDLGIEADPEYVYDEVLPTIERAGQWTGTTTCVRTDGSTFPAEHSLTQTEDDELICVIRDVTENKERERDLELFQNLIDQSNDAVFVIDPNTGRFLDVNDTASRRLGYDRAELLELSIPDIAEQLPDLEDWRNLVEDIATNGEKTLESRHERKDGTTFPVEVNATFVELDQEYILCVARDITERKENKQKLEKSERRYRTLVENFPNGAVALYDEDLRYITAGGENVQQVGLTIEEMEGSPVAEVLPDELADQLVPPYRAAVERGEPQAFEVNFEDWHYQFYALPVHDEEGEVFAGMGMSQDVTERMRVQQQLQEERDMFADGPAVVFRWVPDEEAGWPVEYVSENVEDVLGYSAEEFESGAVPYADLLLEEEIDRIAREVEENSDGTTERFSHEPYRIETKEGEIRWVKDITKIVRDESGEITNYLGYLVDITDRKERERELQRVRDRMEFALNSTNAIVWDWNVEEDQASFYPAAESLYGTTVEDWEDFIEVIHPDDRETVEESIRKSLETGETKQEEVRIIRDGEVRWIEAPGRPIEDDDGQTRMVGVARDITERKTYERKLKESNDRLEQFAYAASHDLQEPLRMVSSYLQLIEDRYADELDEGGEEFIEFAVDGADRMREMINALLEYSRVETEGDPFEPVDLDSVLEDVLADLRIQIEEHDAEITAENLPEVEGDASQLRAVFQNLLKNAIEYSGDEPPRIDISADRAGNEWVLSVSDEGIGIDPEDQERIFEVFERLHTRDEHAGTGIGLALCKRIVERHGGDIWVDSAPGEGATFSLSLPTSDNT